LVHDAWVPDEPRQHPDVVTTERLTLRTPKDSDVAQVFAMYRDPQVWKADPLSRHDTPEQTARMVENWRAAWRRDGFGMWTAWQAVPDGASFIGIGGCFVRHGVAWNLGFRLLPRFWGHGYAQEIGAAASTVAHSLRPDLPLTAYLLEGNDRSQRTVERLGLTLVWRGPDAGNPDTAAIRLLFSDRRLSPEVVDTLTRQ
jgi:RimJ/RimL family protein N-acetyltransferase